LCECGLCWDRDPVFAPRGENIIAREEAFVPEEFFSCGVIEYLCGNHADGVLLYRVTFLPDINKRHAEDP